MEKTFVWDDEKVLDFVRYTMVDSPLIKSRYADLEDFKKDNSPAPDTITLGTIKTVRRISDNEVFTIGDETNYGVITGFRIVDDKFQALYPALGDWQWLISVEHKKIERPPLGVIPKFLHDEKRLDDLCAAMCRYREAKFKPPTEWYIEIADLITNKNELTKLK